MSALQASVFGFKTAFLIIHQQGQTIQSLQQARIDQLEKELRRLRNDSRPGREQSPEKKKGRRRGLQRSIMLPPTQGRW